MDAPSFSTVQSVALMVMVIGSSVLDGAPGAGACAPISVRYGRCCRQAADDHDRPAHGVSLEVEHEDPVVECAEQRE